MTLRNAFDALATESTLQEVADRATDSVAALAAIQALSEQVRELNDNLLLVAQTLLDRLPRVNSNDQAAVSIEAGSVGIAAAQTLATVTTVTTVGTVTAMTNLANVQQIGARPLHGETLMNAGLTPIYNNLVIT